MLIFAALLTTCIGFYFWGAIFGGDVLSPADFVYQYPFFRQATPDRYVHASNPLLSDPVLKFYPWQVTVRDALSHGEFPLWNPYIDAGAPLLANGESAVLYPINVLGYLLPIQKAQTFSACLRVLIAGIGMFIFLQTLEAGWFGSTIGALAFAFGGSMVVWLDYPIGYAYAWMPLLFFLLDRLLVTRKLIWTPLLAATVAAQFLAGHYQTSLIMLVALGAYCLYRLASQRRHREGILCFVRCVLASTVAVVLGCLLVAIQMIPFVEWLQQSSEVQRRFVERGASFVAPDWWKNLAAMITFVLPNIFGNPTSGTPMSFFYSNYIEQMGYMGIVPITIAVVTTLVVMGRIKPDSAIPKAGSIWHQQGNVRFFAALGVFFLALAVRLPVVDLINHLPLLDLVATERYRLVYTFCIAVLAGLGSQSLIEELATRNIARWVIRGLLGFAILGTMLLATIRLALAIFSKQLLTYGRFRAVYPFMVQQFSIDNVAMYFPLAIAIVFAAVLVAARRRMFWVTSTKTLVIGMVLADLFVFGQGFNPAIPASNVFPMTDAVRFLQAQLKSDPQARIVALNDDMPANTATPYGFFDAAGTDFPSRRYRDLTQVMGGAFPDPSRITFATLRSQFIDLLGVRYVIAKSRPQGVPEDQLHEVYADPWIHIYENVDRPPRAFIVHRAEVIESESKVLDAMLSPTFDLQRTVILDTPLSRALSDNSGGVRDTVRFVEYRPDRVVLEANAGTDGLLLLSDSYYPGWSVTVDGTKQPLYRADYDFRAVYLAKGSHEVEFRYEPSAFRLGVVVTTVALLVTVLLIGAGLRPSTVRSGT